MESSAQLAELDARLRRQAADGLEQIMQLEREAICAETGASRAGTAPRTIAYQGWTFRDFRIPRFRRPDGTYGLVPLYQEELKVRPLDFAPYSDAGVSLRDFERLLDETVPGGAPRGTAPSSAQRQRADRMAAQLEWINGQPLEKEGIVALQLDSTEIDDNSVLVALAITVTGRKLVAGISTGPNEEGEWVRDFLQGLVDRGLDRRVVFVVDGGRGLWRGIEMLHLPGPDGRPQPYFLQSCLVHHVRKVTNRLPEAMRDDVRARMYDAWGEDDLAAHDGPELADLAKRKLLALADELERDDFEPAATSLRNGLEETLTLIRLGVDRKTRRALQNTNNIESIMDAIDERVRDVPEWNSLEMRSSWAASALAKMQPRWSRAADPPGLIALRRTLEPDGFDPSAWLWRMPPTLTVRMLEIPTDDAQARESPLVRGGTWLGSERALGLFGLQPGGVVTAEQLTTAFQGRHARTRLDARLPSKGKPSKRRTVKRTPMKGLLEWRLEASESLALHWAEADPARRTEIEQALVASAERALRRLTGTGRDGRGVAAAARVWVDEGAGPSGGPRIGVDGVAFGVVRGFTGPLAYPLTKEALKPIRARGAADAAHDSLVATLNPPAPEQRRGPVTQRGPRRAPRAGDSLDRYARFITGTHRQHIESEVAAVARDAEAMTDEWLLARRRWLGDPFGKLNKAGAAGIKRLASDKAIARKKLEQSRAPASRERLKARLSGLDATEKAIEAKGTHPRQWHEKHGRRAAWVVAIEREAARRGLELDWEQHVEPLAMARDARAKLLEPYRPMLGDRRLESLVVETDWHAAWIRGWDTDRLATQRHEIGMPLDDIQSELRPWNPDPTLPDAHGRRFDRLLQEHHPRLQQWLAIEGELVAQEQATPAPERETTTARRPQVVRAIEASARDVEVGAGMDR